VIGGGNAALCAALMAREAGASVLLLESAPRAWRGGNSAHTRNLRCMHDAPQDVLVEAYPEEEFWQDLLKVTGGLTNEHLARLVTGAAGPAPAPADWMRSHGVHFQPPLSGALHVARTNAFFMGGGKALVNAYYRSAEKLGVQIRYERAGGPHRARNGRLWPRIAPSTASPSASPPKAACWPRAALNPTANGCARPGARTSAASGRPTTS
jgi:tricarballylate dehydrogenase